MQIAICDDSLIDRELVIDLLHSYFNKNPMNYTLTQFENGVDLLYDIEDGSWFDVIFLDIYMSNMLGIQVAHKLRDLNFKEKIIFLTASSEFAVDSYEVDAFGYLLKPLSMEKTFKIMDKVTSTYDSGTYQIRSKSKIISIPYNEITFIESRNSKCILHRKDGTSYNIYKHLSEIESQLDDPRFLRCHQSYFVNMDYICQADKQFLLSTGDTVLIRQRNLKAIKQIYIDYCISKSR